jgi:hypothetical protein
MQKKRGTEWKKEREAFAAAPPLSLPHATYASCRAHNRITISELATRQEFFLSQKISYIDSPGSGRALTLNLHHQIYKIRQQQHLALNY